MRKFLWILLILFACGGLFFWLSSALHSFEYFTAPQGQAQGAAGPEQLAPGGPHLVLAFFLAAPFWFAVSVVSMLLRNAMEKGQLLAVNLPSAISALVVVATQFGLV